MLLALALMTQGVTTNTEAEAALACGNAVYATRAADGSNSVPVMLQSVYLMMTAGQADRGTGRMMDRTGQFANNVFKDSPLKGAQLTIMLDACDKRYPLARATAPVKLPTDPFDRDVMCFAAASYVGGLLEGAGIEEGKDEYKRVQDGYLGHLSDTVLKQRGMSEVDKLVDAMDDALVASLRIGNLEVVMKACSAQLGR